VTCGRYQGFSGLVLIDVSDPTTPQPLGDVALSGAHFNDMVVVDHVVVDQVVVDQVVADRLVYIASDTHGVQIVDVTDPAQPVLIAAALAPAACRRIAVGGDLLYTAMRESGLAVHDISDPASPVFLGHTSDAGEGWGAGLYGGYVYVAKGYHTVGLQVCYRQCDDSVPLEWTPDDDLPPAPVFTTRLTSIAPNPFNPRTTISFTVDRPQQLSVAIYDAAGRRVAQLASGIFAAGEHRLVWDGSDGSGKACASGLYLVRLQAEDAAATCKMLLMR
jgi:hypothetical protein